MKVYVVVSYVKGFYDGDEFSIPEIIKMFDSESKAISFIKERYGNEYRRGPLYDTWYLYGNIESDYITIDEWEVE